MWYVDVVFEGRNGTYCVGYEDIRDYLFKERFGEVPNTSTYLYEDRQGFLDDLESKWLRNEVDVYNIIRERRFIDFILEYRVYDIEFECGVTYDDWDELLGEWDEMRAKYGESEEHNG